MSSRFVLLFGGNGFIGKSVGRRLNDAAIAFRICGRAGLERAEVELRDPTDAIDLSTVWGASIEQSVALCLRNVAFASAAGARRFVYVSSGGAIYGNVDALPIAETAPERPVSTYGRCKLACERALADAASSADIELVIVRPGNAYGPGHRHGTGQGLVTAAFHAARTGSPLTIFGDGSQIRDYIFIDDVASGILAALDHGEDGEAYNIGTGVGTSVTELISKVTALVGPIAVDYQPGRDSDVTANILDSTKLKKISAWSIATAVREGLERIAWSRSAPTG